MCLYSASGGPSSWMQSVGHALGGAVHLLPTQISKVWTQDRSFATVHLKSGELKTTIAMNV